MNFRPEFINRIDEFIIFDPLAKDQIKEIVRIQVRRRAVQAPRTPAAGGVVQQCARVVRMVCLEVCVARSAPPLC